jgi:hypothetical protein
MDTGAGTASMLRAWVCACFCSPADNRERHEPEKTAREEVLIPFAQEVLHSTKEIVYYEQ